RLGDGQLQQALGLAAGLDGLVEGDLRSIEAGGEHYLEESPAQSVIDAPQRPQTPPEIREGAEGRGRLAAGRGQVPVLAAEEAARPEQASLLGEGAFGLRQVDQQEAAIDEVERFG